MIYAKPKENYVGRIRGYGVRRFGEPLQEFASRFAVVKIFT